MSLEMDEQNLKREEAPGSHIMVQSEFDQRADDKF